MLHSYDNILILLSYILITLLYIVKNTTYLSRATYLYYIFFIPKIYYVNSIFKE